MTWQVWAVAGLVAVNVLPYAWPLASAAVKKITGRTEAPRHSATDIAAEMAGVADLHVMLCGAGVPHDECRRLCLDVLEKILSHGHGGPKP